MLDTRDLVFLPIFLCLIAGCFAFAVWTMRRSNRQTELLIEGNRLLSELVALTRERR